MTLVPCQENRPLTAGVSRNPRCTSSRFISALKPMVIDALALVWSAVSAGTVAGSAAASCKVSCACGERVLPRTTLNAEIVVLLYNARVCAQLAEEQARYVRDGEMLTLESWRKRPPAIKVAENLARLLSPLL